MMKSDVWVFIETENLTCGAGLDAVSQAKKLAEDMGGELSCVVIGEDTQGLVDSCGEYGADSVIRLPNSVYADYSTDAYTDAFSYLVGKYVPAVILFEATDNGRDLAARLARRLDTGLASGCTGFALSDESGRITWTRTVFGGELIVTARCEGEGPQLATLRPGAFKRGDRQPGRRARLIEEDFASSNAVRAMLLETVMNAEGDGPSIQDAEIVVAGGMGVGGEEGFHMLEELAKLLGGAVGASRAATDAGWISTAHLVGQTGKIIRPKLYIACGISGALQHVCGMCDSDIIVAINKDAGAPIFQTADYGIVGDIFKVIPAMIEEIKRLRSK